ncbi:MAG: glycosyltransferase [Pseudomonadota bacterium]
MKKILIITYVFPPVGGAGVQRTLKWTKYLPEFGWKPYVLTASNPSVPVFDDSLAAEIPKDLPITRTRTFELPYRMRRSVWNQAERAACENRGSSLKARVLGLLKGTAQRVFMPDPQIGWWPTAYLKAVRLIRAEGIDAIVISAPPFSTLLLGRKIAQKTRVPWIADFRDEWADFYTQAFDFHRRPGMKERIAAMEKSVVESASAVIAVTEAVLRSYRGKYPRLSESNSFWVPNGFDAEEFEGEDPPSLEPDRFTITYSGTVFEVTTARFFLAALKNVLERQPDLRTRLRVRFLGRIVPPERPPFEDRTFEGVLECLDYVPHTEAVRFIQSSNANLLLLSPVPTAERILPGKIFEYLAAQKPILALVPKGESSRLIEKTSSGVSVSPTDTPAIERAIEELIARGVNARPAPRHPDIEKFSRRETTRQLAQILDQRVSS